MRGRATGLEIHPTVVLVLVMVVVMLQMGCAAADTVLAVADVIQAGDLVVVGWAGDGGAAGVVVVCGVYEKAMVGGGCFQEAHIRE